MIESSRVDRKSTQLLSRQGLAKIAFTAQGVAGFAVAGLSGASAHDGDGWDDDIVFAPSGGFVVSNDSVGSVWDDDVVFTGISGSGGSDDLGWDDHGNDD